MSLARTAALLFLVASGCSDTPDLPSVSAQTGATVIDASVPSASDAGTETPHDPNDPCAPRPPEVTDYRAVWIEGQSTVGAPVDLAVADMDRDGNEDIVVTRGGFDDGEQGVVEILYGPHALPAGCSSTDAGAGVEKPRRWDSKVAKRYAKLAVGDIDRDDCIDIVAGNFTGGADVFMGVRAGATGRCEPPSKSQLVDDPLGIADAMLIDLNDDGALDLVAARFDRAKPNKGNAPRIYWNKEGVFDVSAPWESESRLVGALSVIGVALDADGKTDDLLFGARAVASSGTFDIAWGVGFRKVGAEKPSKQGLVFHRASGASSALENAPYVVSVSDMSAAAGSPRIAVTSSLHWCVNETCSASSKLEAYVWTSGAMVLDPRFATSGPGNWLPGATGQLNADGAPDFVAGFACGTRQQSPGRLLLLQSPSYEPKAFGDRDYIVRATAMGRLKGGGSSTGEVQDIVFGTVEAPSAEAPGGSQPGGSQPGSSQPGSRGKVAVLFKCSKPKE